MEGLASVELRGRTFTCASGLSSDALTLLSGLLPNTQLISNPLVIGTLEAPGDDCVVSGDAVLAHYGMSHPVGYTVGVLMAYLRGLHVLTYLALLHASKRTLR